MMERWLGMPVAASAHADGLDFTMGLVHWLMLALLVGWGGFFLYTLVRFRQKRQPRADYVGTRSKTSTWAEAGVAVAEVLLLAGFSIPAWATRVSTPPPDGEAVVVRVVAEQFACNVHYPGPDGMFGSSRTEQVSPSNPIGLDRASDHAADDVVAINQIHLPVDRPVVVQLSTKDVIHSFGLPNFRVKQDAIPDDDPRLVRAEPDRTVRDRVLAALRPRSLPDARLRDGGERSGVRRVAGGAETVTA